MLSFDQFRVIVEKALAGKSASELCRRAGLPANAISELRRGKQPTWDRAARIVDALGLELHVRRKGEGIDLRALELAIGDLRHPAIGAGMSREGIGELAVLLSQTYVTYAAALDPKVTADPDSLYLALLAMQEERHAQQSAGATAPGGESDDGTAGSGDESSSR